MKTTSSQWKTKQLAEAFLNGVRGAIPGAALQLAVLGKIVEQWRPQAASVLDVGCGDGILGRFLLDRLPGCRVTFVDFSEPMLDALRSRLAGDPRATILQRDFADPSWCSGLPAGTSHDVVVSGFAIHHQPDLRKRELYAEIFGLLAPGGVFLNLEHVASATPAGEGIFDEFFIDALHAFHGASGAARSREEIADTYYNRPDKTENILAPIGVQCDWLREIGFCDVDCFFKVFELALFGGRRVLRARSGATHMNSGRT